MHLARPNAPVDADSEGKLPFLTRHAIFYTRHAARIGWPLASFGTHFAARDTRQA